MRRDLPLCHFCKHFDYKSHESRIITKCDAFPEEIPDAIFGDEYGADFDHRNLYPDDNGMQFEKVEFEEFKKRRIARSFPTQEKFERALQTVFNYFDEMEEARKRHKGND